MKTERQTTMRVPAAGRMDGAGAVAGLARASELARAGRFISAIRHLEAANPEISREQAKAIVDEIGYSREYFWPDWESPPEMDRHRIRCL